MGYFQDYHFIHSLDVLPEHLQPQVNQPCLFHLHHPVKGPKTKHNKLLVKKKQMIKTKAIQINTPYTMNYHFKLLHKVHYGTQYLVADLNRTESDLPVVQGIPLGLFYP